MIAPGAEGGKHERRRPLGGVGEDVQQIVGCEIGDFPLAAVEGCLKVNMGSHEINHLLGFKAVEHGFKTGCEIGFRPVLQMCGDQFEHGARHQLFAGGGLHPGGAGERHGTAEKIDHPDPGILDHFTAADQPFAEQFRRIVEEQENFRTAVGRLFDGSDHRTGLAPLGDGDQEICRPHAEIGDLAAAEALVILEGFNRTDQREVAAGHDAQDRFRVTPQFGFSGDEFPPDRLQEDAEPSGGAAAGEDDSSAGFDGPESLIRHLPEERTIQNSADHRQHVAVRKLEHTHTVGAPGEEGAVEVTGQGIGLFGRQKTEVEFGLPVQEFLRLFMGR